MGNPRDTYVIVTVDTVNIEQSNKKLMVEFTDNRGDPPSYPGNPNGFVSIVNRGKKIIWIGIAKDSDEYLDSIVDIKEISRKSEDGGADILKLKKYTDKKDNGVVVGKIKDKDESGSEYYNITILVNNVDYYTLDPQLQMSR